MALGTLGIGEQINGVNLGNWLVLELSLIHISEPTRH